MENIAYAECRGPAFEPILVGRDGSISAPEIVKRYELDPARLGRGLKSPTHLVYKIPEGCAAVSSHFVEKDPICIETYNPTKKALETAKKIAKEMSEKHGIDEFWLGKKSSISYWPWVEPSKRSKNIEELFADERTGGRFRKMFRKK